MRPLVIIALVAAGVLLILAPLQFDYMIQSDLTSIVRATGVTQVHSHDGIGQNYLWGCFTIGVVLILTAIFQLQSPRPRHEDR